MHLRALANLSGLIVLNLGAREWEDARVKPGLDFLVARLPRLRVFNAPAHVLVCMFSLSRRSEVSQASYPAILRVGHCFWLA